MEEKCPNCQQKAFINNDCQACGFHEISQEYQKNLLKILTALRVACSQEKVTLGDMYLEIKTDHIEYGKFFLLQVIEAFERYGFDLENYTFLIEHDDPETGDIETGPYFLNEIEITSDPNNPISI